MNQKTQELENIETAQLSPNVEGVSEIQPSQSQAEPQNKEGVQAAPLALVQSQQQSTILADLSYFNPAIFEQQQRLVKVFIDSGALTKDMNAAKLLMILQAGFEIGMKPVESLNSLYIVNGKVTIYGAAIGARFRKYGYIIDYEDTENACTVTVTHENGIEYQETLSFDEAEASGWTRNAYNGDIKAGWKSGANRRLKLRYGALNFLAKTKTPEVLGGSIEGITEISLDTIPAEIIMPKNATENGSNSGKNQETSPAPAENSTTKKKTAGTKRKTTKKTSPSKPEKEAPAKDDPDWIKNELDQTNPDTIRKSEKKLAPIPNANNPASDEQKKNYKKLSGNDAPDNWTNGEAVMFFRELATKNVKK